MSVVAFTLSATAPTALRSLLSISHEHLTIGSFAIVIGDRMEAAGWTKSQHGSDLCPDCSVRPKFHG